MENRLQLLYSLQLVDSNLDELQEMKGDLPKIVAELSETIKGKLVQKKELDDILKKSIINRDKADVDILSLKEKIEKYKSQQFQVKTNNVGERGRSRSGEDHKTPKRDGRSGR